MRGVLARGATLATLAKLATLATLVISTSLSLGCGYNGVINRDEAVKAAWSEVENQYQRRADLVPNLVATVKGGKPGLPPLDRRVEFPRDRPQHEIRVGMHGQRRTAVLAQVRFAAIEPDEGGATRDVTAVIQAEVTRHAGEHHEVGLAERGATLVAQLHGVSGTEQPSRHP